MGHLFAPANLRLLIQIKPHTRPRHPIAWAWLLTAIAVTATIYLAYRWSSVMARLFGEEGTGIVTRLSAFLLLCVGVQIMITGISEVARSLLDRA
jgi:small neutral amino acid transporter SnatA (MarC family)